MIKTAFDLSEQLSLPVLFRSVTRVSHARGNVRLGELPKVDPKPSFGKSERFSVIPTIPKYHIHLHEKLNKAKKFSEESPYNFYRGPEKPELIVITCGSGWPHSSEAIKSLNVEGKVGVLKLGMTWPLPEELVVNHMSIADRFLFVEETDPVLEDNIKALYGQNCAERKLGTKTFFGKASGHIPDVGELNPEIVISALKKLTDASYEARPADYVQRIHEATANNYIPDRAQAYCPGCPHRAIFWGVKKALALDGRGGFVLGDIGCYAMAVGPSGFNQIRTVHAMGSGAGLASGFGELDKFGFSQPVIAVCGDGTFFHSASAALANGFYNNSNFILLILDNSATAMTGFQTHPGIGKTATGKEAGKIEIEKLCEALGAHVEVADPLDLKGFVDSLVGLLKNEKRGPKVLIARRECALVRVRSMGQSMLFNMEVIADLCRGEDCRLCTRVFRCPALLVDKMTGKAGIDEALCNGCGVCAEICPASAIVKEKV
jgi:indolepyruvate ferredoxin oxidoreductase alpha subunit